MTSTSFTFRIDPDLLKKFKAMALVNNRNGSQLVRDFMIGYLRPNGVDNANAIIDNFKQAKDCDLSDKFSIRVSKDLLENFKKKASKHKHVPSVFIRAAILEYIDIIESNVDTNPL